MPNCKSVPSLSPEKTEEFWSLVDRSGGIDACWEWRGSRVEYGYGLFFVGKTSYRAHRVALTLADGPIHSGLLACHSCDNPPCCNPMHLWPGTDEENSRDMASKSRSALGDRNGSRLHRERMTRGEQRPLAKLTASDVVKVRQLAAEGVFHREIAARFGVSRSLIGQVVNGSIWKHVPSEECAA
jgi:hypothetical protein